MSNYSSWTEFELDEIFEKISVKKISGKAGDFPAAPGGEYVVPLLTAGIENQGLSRYAKRSQCPTILSNVISISANGANSGVSFYQDREFAVLQDAYAIRLREGEIPSKEVGLFLAACLNKLLHGHFDWSNKAGWNNIKHLPILLPTTPPYSLDFGYMREYISKLEKEYITKLGRRCVAELKECPATAGLNDYVLTEEEREKLSRALISGATKLDILQTLLDF